MSSELNQEQLARAYHVAEEMYQVIVALCAFASLVPPEQLLEVFGSEFANGLVAALAHASRVVEYVDGGS